MADDNLVELFPGVERTDHLAPVRTRPRPLDARARFCLHFHYELDNDSRRVYCRDCGVEVPAFSALHAISEDWERYVRSRETARRQKESVERSLAEARRQEKNARARLRRLKRELGPSLTVHQIDYLLGLLERDPAGPRVTSMLRGALRAMREEIAAPE